MNSSTSTSSSIRCGVARGKCGSTPNGGLTSVAHALDRREDLAFSTRGGHRMDLPSLVRADRQLGHPSSDRREDRQVHLSSDRRGGRSSSDRREDRSSSDHQEDRSSSGRREDRSSSDRQVDRSSSGRREDRSSSDRREGLACWVPVDRLSLDRGGRSSSGRREGHACLDRGVLSEEMLLGRRCRRRRRLRKQHRSVDIQYRFPSPSHRKFRTQRVPRRPRRLRPTSQ